MSFKLGRLELQPDFDAYKNWQDSSGLIHEYTIPTGGTPISQVKSVDLEKVSVSFPLARTTATAGQYLQQQVRELRRNPDVGPLYLQWSGATQYNGFYDLNKADIRIPEGGISGGIAEFKADLTKIGRDDDIQNALQLNKATRTTSYVSMTAQSVHSFPYGASVFSSSGTFYTRTGSEGTLSTVIDATNQNIFPYEQDPSNIGKGDVRVYDDMNSADRTNWIEIFGADHKFIGDAVVENGLARFKSNIQTGTASPGMISHYYYDGTQYTLSHPIYFEAKGGINYGTTSPKVSLNKVSSEESEVSLTYPPQTNSLKVKLRLRRGFWQTEAKPSFITGAIPGTFWSRFVNQVPAAGLDVVQADATHSAGTATGTYSTANATKNFIVGYDVGSSYYNGMARQGTNANPNQFVVVAGSKIQTFYMSTGTDWISFFAVKDAGTVNDTPDDLGSQLLMDSKVIPKLIRR